MGTTLTADQFLRFLTQAVFVAVFLLVGLATLRRPRRAGLNTTLFFGVFALIITLQWAIAGLQITPNPALSVVSGALFMALPYLMVRLVEDFSSVATWVVRVAGVGFVVSVALLSVMASWPANDSRRALPTAAISLYFVAYEIYGAVQFARESRRSTGVTRRRMQAVAVGSVFLGLVMFMALLQRVLPELEWLWTILLRTAGLASGIAYAVGFAPPGLLRRAWQEPELRAFLERAASLPRLPTTDAIIDEIQRGAAEATGAPSSSIGMWNQDGATLRYASQALGGDGYDAPPGSFIGGRAFQEQRAIFSENAIRDDPDNAARYLQSGARAVLAAPITAGTQRLGVLTVYASRSPIFADDDLRLVQLLADQAAVILESRSLIDEATRVRAREEAARLRDDFLSAAAHDLKTPLTTMLAQAQLLERKAQRDPTAPADMQGLQRIVAETRRLSELVLELLDASRAEQGRLVGVRETMDIAPVLREAAERHSSDRHPCRLATDGSVEGGFDRTRIEQLVNNLIENAIKYSPEGGAVELRTWIEGETAHITVADHGIGIPTQDLPRVFDRFHRGKNVDDRQFAGMGLGLFICRAIVEEHGGRIEATSREGEGTTIHARFPVTASSATAVLVSASGPRTRAGATA